jgi:dynein heavy chain
MLFNWTVDPILENMRNNLVEISPTQDQNLVRSLIRMFQIYINDFYDQVFLTQDIKIRHTVIDSYFVLSVVWSLGGSVVTESRKPFDLFMKKLFALDIKFPDIKTKKIYVPDRGQIFDYKYMTKSGGQDGQWVNWNDLIDKTEIISDKL